MIRYTTVELTPGTEPYNRVGWFLRIEGDANPDEQVIADTSRLEWCAAAVIAAENDDVVGVALIADPGFPHPSKPSVDVVYVLRHHRDRKDARIGANLFENAVRFASELFPGLRVHCTAANPVMIRIAEKLPVELRNLVDMTDD